MEHQPWLDELRKEFVRRKLPPHYAKRLLAELTDHFNDFKEDRMSTDTADLTGVVHQLGSPRDIGAAATAQYRRQRFSGRHPFWVFAVLPIVSLPLLFVSLLFGIGWLLYLIVPEETLAANGAEPDWVPMVGQALDLRLHRFAGNRSLADAVPLCPKGGPRLEMAIGLLHASGRAERHRVHQGRGEDRRQTGAVPFGRWDAVSDENRIANRPNDRSLGHRRMGDLAEAK